MTLRMLEMMLPNPQENEVSVGGGGGLVEEEEEDEEEEEEEDGPASVSGDK